MVRDRDGLPMLSNPVMLNGVWRVVYKAEGNKYNVFKTNDSDEATKFYEEKLKEINNEST